MRQLLERALLELPPKVRDEVLAGAAALARPVLLEPDPASRSDEAPHATMHGLYWVAAGLAARRPLLLAVDDAHWSDAPSLRWLAYLGRRLDGVGLLLLIGHRHAEPGTDVSLLERVLHEAGASMLRPASLTETAVARWLEAVYERAPSPAFVRACWTATAGNPFMLRELCASLQADGVPPDATAAPRLDTTAPANVARAFLTRLAALGDDAQAVAETVAILSADSRLDRIAAVSGVPLERTAAIVDRLAAAGILSDGDAPRFRHPILRSAIYQQTPAGRRGVSHLAAAKRLLAENAGPAQAATHLMLAPGGGHPWAVDTLRSAARSAVAQGAPDAAVPLLRRALAEPPADRVAVLLELAAAEAIVHDAAAVEHGRQAIAEAAEPGRRAQAAVLTARALSFSGRQGEAWDVLDERAGERLALDDSARRAIEAEELLQRGWRHGVADSGGASTSSVRTASRENRPANAPCSPFVRWS